MDGGENLPANTAMAANYFNDAADCATECMKGKLAQKYYEMAAFLDG
jgi:hypothetical protein